MPSPFLILRFLFLALIFYLSLLTLIFSSWNINVSSSAGLGVPGSSAFLILNSCLVFIVISLGLVPLVWPQFNTAQVIVECSWSAILGLLQIGAAIATTVVSSSVVHQTDDSAVNASSFLLIPSTWLSSLCTLAYFLILLLTSMTHLRHDTDLWSKSVYDVKWFGVSTAGLDSSDVSAPRPKTGFEEDTWAKYLDDIESTAGRKARFPAADIEKAPWASNDVRRGRDAPFQVSSRNGSESSSRQSSVTPSPRSNDALPPLPLRVEPKGLPIASRFIERFRESQQLTRAGTFNAFAKEVEDHDLPIPLTRFSRWIRADGAKNNGRTP
ncbi:hypothetical protein D9758_003240 [Tetrapyrgos nigripes]|uniref:Transmembrane protein n=1 Tax=Tetrapyrgos nigripes TaxID=182062 RepID=A0A8H5GIM7_9AGAR|nr:hypothetical protein D9758_003240 [Tetrapyrgos nigripes]